jgi:Ni,Fe-hydrogenase III small subunit/Pyruvate/2-oxoacid:ferredoxin oxidoreductase delta subunit
MFKILIERIQQGHRTAPYPPRSTAFSPRFRGTPLIDAARCRPSCNKCEASCPTDAVILTADGPKIDLGRCIFCMDCSEACPQQAIRHSTEYRLAARERDHLIVKGEDPALIEACSQKMQKLFGRSLKLRQVSAGGCNGCEVDINVLSTLAFDLGRFGIQVVASPRHADGIIVTGPVTANMKLALEKTYAAVADPKLVIAVGSCAISGGLFQKCGNNHTGLEGVLPVDLYIPGCPPHPWSILDGMMRYLNKVESQQSGSSK